ncbi:MAG: peptidoglycan-associated lipoprotein Pal [Deltaproteobacteria bacterium]|nr:peptidoglycan-associated lipoprotein Pal [Deltaproteobacteria bacterium]
MIKKTIMVLGVLAFVLSMLMVSSCAKKQVRVEEEVTKPAPTPAPSPAPGPAPGPQPAPSRPGVEEKEYGEAEAEREARVREIERAQQLRKGVLEFESEHIYFDFDKAELKPEARKVLVKKAEWLRKHPEYKVVIEGHCDERGTNEYNLALGERRANAAWRFLNALGISGERMSTISYGEERPLDPRHNPAAWAKNRRAEFKLVK